jgi:hypothetical protein
MVKSYLSETEKIYCNTCKGWTNHTRIANHERVAVDSDYAGESSEQSEQFDRWNYSFLICLGCDTAVIKSRRSFFAAEAVPIHETYFYPAREKHSLTPKIFIQLSNNLSLIYREIISCYNHNSSILCSVGLRALLEGICADKGIKGSNLYNKIEGLKAILPENIVESLHRYRFIGNEAAHDLQAPELEELRLAIEVMEDLLNFLYELDYRARSLFEGDINDADAVKPNPLIIQSIIERSPLIPRGQKQLYKVLYEAGDRGLEITEIGSNMNRPLEQIYGVLGALGRRINNTPGVQGKPGIGYLLELVRFDIGQRWGWKMRRELRRVLQEKKYPWSDEWLK